MLKTGNIQVRKADTIYQAVGEIDNGTFFGRWHFSFDQFYDRSYMGFGTLRVFNDDTLSPGAIWPLHPHHDIEVVTYCAGGEFRHADQNGVGGILKPGWVQHTTVGRGMYHSELNNRPDEPMRFIQMWFIPESRGLVPSVEQLQVERPDRTNKIFPLVSNISAGALPIRCDAQVFSCFLQSQKQVSFSIAQSRGAYLYILEGGPVKLNSESTLEEFDAAKISGNFELAINADGDCEMLLVEVPL